MRLSAWRSAILFFAGALVSAGAMQLLPQQTLNASVAHGNDKFSMVTVPIAPGEGDAVFVLNHLTGDLTGAVLTNSAGTFTHYYFRKVAADFQTVLAVPDPKYAIVSSQANLRSGSGLQPANGVIYVGELSSGMVFAYTFQMPRGRGAAAPLELVPMGSFPFAAGVRG